MQLPGEGAILIYAWAILHASARRSARNAPTRVAAPRPVFGEEPCIRTSLSLLAIMLLVLEYGFFGATEFALVSVRRSRIQQIASGGNRRAQQVLAQLRDLDTYISATQLGITIASLALVWIGESAVAGLIQPLIG